MASEEFVDEIGLSHGGSECSVWFSARERPHNDELTLFTVRLAAPGGLDAQHSVESLAGDHGLRHAPAQEDGLDQSYEGIRLVEWLRELGSAARPWEAEQRWRSLADELRFTATCDALGHVEMVVTLRPRSWKPPWTATVTLEYALGELVTLARRLDAWFSA